MNYFKLYLLDRLAFVLYVVHNWCNKPLKNCEFSFIYYICENLAPYLNNFGAFLKIRIIRICK